MNMKSHKSFLAKAFLLLPVLFSSCATIISGSYAEIHLDGNVDEPINVVTSKGEYNNLLLPTTVVVKRRHLEGQRILVSSENYAYSDIVLHSSVNPWSVLSAVFYGVPLLVDLSSNAAYEPTQKHFYVVPGAPIAQSDSLRQADSLRMAQATEELKQMYWKTKQLPERYCRHELRAVLGFGNCQASRARDKMIDRYVSRYDLQENGMLHDLFGTAYVQAGFEYHYRLNRKWEIGMLVNWGVSNDNYDTSNDFDYYYSSYGYPHLYGYANEHCNFFVFAPSVRYTWYETPGIRSYSRIALGTMRHHLKFDYANYYWSAYDPLPDISTQKPEQTGGVEMIKWRMAYQLTAIGASIGGNSFNFFGELGYGSLGIIRLGVGFVF